MDPYSCVVGSQDTSPSLTLTLSMMKNLQFIFSLLPRIVPINLVVPIVLIFIYVKHI